MTVGLWADAVRYSFSSKTLTYYSSPVLTGAPSIESVTHPPEIPRASTGARSGGNVVRAGRVEAAPISTRPALE